MSDAPDHMPIMRNPDLVVPWSVIAPHEAQARRNHGGQSLHTLEQRGGLSACEAVAILEDRGWSRMGVSRATARLRELISAG